jgi:hypothetical protein
VEGGVWEGLGDARWEREEHEDVGIIFQEVDGRVGAVEAVWPIVH